MPGPSQVREDVESALCVRDRDPFELHLLHDVERRSHARGAAGVAGQRSLRDLYGQLREDLFTHAAQQVAVTSGELKLAVAGQRDLAPLRRESLQVIRA